MFLSLSFFALFFRSLILLCFLLGLFCSAPHVSPPPLLQVESPAMKKTGSLLSLNTPNSNRKRRRQILAQLAKETEISPFPPLKRPSAEHSLSMGSLLDISNTPETCKALGGESCQRCRQELVWEETPPPYTWPSGHVSPALLFSAHDLRSARVGGRGQERMSRHGSEFPHCVTANSHHIEGSSAIR